MLNPKFVEKKIIPALDDYNNHSIKMEYEVTPDNIMSPKWQIGSRKVSQNGLFTPKSSEGEQYFFGFIVASCIFTSRMKKKTAPETPPRRIKLMDSKGWVDE
jgi:hypothetical protein